MRLSHEWILLLIRVNVGHQLCPYTACIRWLMYFLYYVTLFYPNEASEMYAFTIFNLQMLKLRLKNIQWISQSQSEKWNSSDSSHSQGDVKVSLSNRNPRPDSPSTPPVFRAYCRYYLNTVFSFLVPGKSYNSLFPLSSDVWKLQRDFLFLRFCIYF